MFSAEINQRVEQLSQEKMLTAFTCLGHFSLITYLVEVAKLRALVPSEFDVYSIYIQGKEYGLVSAVNFVEKDFRFPNIAPFARFDFMQTNYRAYIIDKTTKENCVWFFGTGLSSNWVCVPKHVWKMPWFYSSFVFDVKLANHKYEKHSFQIQAKNANADVEIEQIDSLPFKYDGFSSLQEAELILLYPITGYFKRSDSKIGTYKIWHDRLQLKNGTAKAYFELFEKLGLLTKQEMLTPYSVVLVEQVDFRIDLPPRIAF